MITVQSPAPTRPGIPAPQRVPCTRDTPRCADARSYEAELRPCCREHLKALVADTVAALDAEGAVYWADYGTLLGAVRNPLTTWADYPWLAEGHVADEPLAPGIIPHDKDADFGVLSSDWAKLMRVRSRLDALGYNVIVRPQVFGLKIRLSALNHTNLDLFGWQLRSNGYYYRLSYLSVDSFKGREFPRSKLLPLSTIPWEGFELAAPADPAAFCSFRYGTDWRTPLPNNHDGVRR